MGVLINLMALAHPLHPIKSRSMNKRRNLWVEWCVSSWRPWFWPVYSIYYICWFDFNALTQHDRFMPLKICQKHNPNDTPEAALHNWQPYRNTQVSISTPVCINFELHPGAGDIHICWFNFDALTQGSTYKLTKEQNNIVDPVGIEITTSRPRQHRQLPVVQHDRFMPLKLCQKHNPNDMPEAALDNWQPVWNAQVSISTPVCVNFELRPGAGDIHICWFHSDALAQGNAYKPTKEPINYRGPVEDWTPDDLGSGPCTSFIIYIPYLITAILIIKDIPLSKRHTYQKLVWPCWCIGWFDTVIVSCLVSSVHFSCIVQYALYHNMNIGTMWHCALVSSTPSQSIGLAFGVCVVLVVHFLSIYCIIASCFFIWYVGANANYLTPQYHHRLATYSVCHALHNSQLAGKIDYSLERNIISYNTPTRPENDYMSHWLNKNIGYKP